LRRPCSRRWRLRVHDCRYAALISIRSSDTLPTMLFEWSRGHPAGPMTLGRWTRRVSGILHGVSDRGRSPRELHPAPKRRRVSEFLAQKMERQGQLRSCPVHVRELPPTTTSTTERERGEQLVRNRWHTNPTVLPIHRFASGTASRHEKRW
jgi:hypothetical protein